MANRKRFYDIGREAMEGMIRDLQTDKPLTRREVVLENPPAHVTPGEIISLRTAVFGVSQHVFAMMLNVSAKTLQSWEQGRNTPAGATLKLLDVVRRHPGVLRASYHVARGGKWRTVGRTVQKPRSHRD